MSLGVELTGLPSFGRYQPLFKIAAGGMAEVYGARVSGEAGFQRWVALKRILPHLSEDQRFVEMFLDEARLAAMVQSIHVVPTLDLGRASDGSLYIVMDLVVGVTLGLLHHGAQRAGAPLPVPLLAELVAQAAQGLHDAHEARSETGEPLHIVHRDVSPRNILVGLDGRARILDFGIAAGELRATQTAIGELKGTQAYFSPEQAAMQKVDRRSDVYALGIVLWEGLVGERMPRPDGRGAPGRVDARRAEVPSAVADVVERALSWQRDARFATAEEFASALRLAGSVTGAGSATSEISRLVRLHGAATIERIQAGMQRATVDPGLAAEVSPAKPSTGPLRAYGTSFIGRETDLERLEALLAGDQTLVTLFGPGGMGKTRLAIELAQRVRHRYPGGVVFCDLADARTAEGICFVLGRALGVPSMQGSDIGLVVEALGGVLLARGRVLVILDNLEQALAHIDETLGAWLRIAHGTTFLATSRERLRFEAETLYEVLPLDFDTISSGPGDGSALQTRAARPMTSRSPAARLFIDRATRVRRDFQIDAEAERAIAAIVKRLDGLPLAIELAASRVRLVDPVQLLAELSERLHAPGRGARDANPRQATLDATIRWSWDLLEPDEQFLFASLSVFRGSFDPRAVARVAGHGAGFSRAEGMLEQLVDKSLVRLVPGKPPRFSLLESMREFAGRELEASHAENAVLRQHAAYYGELASFWDVPANAVRPGDIERDLDNLLGAFRWTVAQRVSDDVTVRRVLAMALAMEAVLGVRGPVPLAKQVLEEAVALCASRESEADLDTRVRLGLVRALLMAGQHEQASKVLGEARWVARLAPDRRAEAWALLTEAEWHWARGSLPESLDAAVRALEAGRSVGDALLLARAHFREGTVLLLRGEHGPAKVALERARTIAEQLRYEQFILRVDVSLADVAADMGDLSAAAAITERVAQSAARLGDGALEARALLTQSSLALEADDPARSLALLERAIQLSREVGNTRSEGLFLCFVGVSEECLGERAKARVSFTDAIEKNVRAGNRLGEGLAYVYRGRLHARGSSMDAAQADLETGAKILKEVGDRVRVVVAMLCGGHLELAKAARAAGWGDASAAQAHAARLHKIIERTRKELSSGQLRSLDVEHALRVLETDLIAYQSRGPEGSRDTSPPDPTQGD